MAYRSSTSATGDSGVSDPSTAVPASVAANDIVILSVTIDITSTFTWPTGFTQLTTGNATLDGQQAACAWKRLTGADTGSYAVTTSANTAQWMCQAAAFSGRDTTNAPVAATVKVSSASGTSPLSIASNAVTVVSGDDLCYIVAPDNTVGATTFTLAAPSGMTSRQNGHTADGFTYLMNATLDNDTTTGSTTKTGTFTFSSGNSGYIVNLIRIPASTASGAALAGSIDGIGSVSGTLTNAQSLASSVDGTGTVNGTLTLSIPLTSSVDGVGTVNGTLILSLALTGSADGLGTVNGTLTPNGSMLASVDGTGAVTATLTSATAALTGSVDGTGNVTGYLFSPSSFYYTIWQKMQGIGV